MSEIKAKYISGTIDTVTAARMLTRHNGNPLTGNLAIVKRWRA